MTMPKGFKSKNGYATTTELGGKSYQQIANIMTERGYVMNHSTARNVFLSAMSKFAMELFEIYNIPASKDKIKQVSSDPRFQSGLMTAIVDLEDVPQFYKFPEG